MGAARRAPEMTRLLGPRSARSRLGVVAVGLVVAAVVAGCSSRDDAATSTPAPVASVPVIVPAPSASPTELPSESIVETTVSTGSGESSADTDIRTRADGLVGDGVQPEGFTTVSALVTSADGETCTVCLWLAVSSDERSRGLKGVTDLGDAAGMAFVFDGPSDGAFVMIDTPTPLSIAWFDADGGFVSALDMEPCTEARSSDCARYRADAPYTLAVEMFQGELDVVGIGPGSTIELLAGSCPAVP